MNADIFNGIITDYRPYMDTHLPKNSLIDLKYILEQTYLSIMMKPFSLLSEMKNILIYVKKIALMSDILTNEKVDEILLHMKTCITNITGYRYENVEDYFDEKADDILLKNNLEHYYIYKDEYYDNLTDIRETQIEIFSNAKIELDNWYNSKIEKKIKLNLDATIKKEIEIQEAINYDDIGYKEKQMYNNNAFQKIETNKLINKKQVNLLNKLQKYNYFQYKDIQDPDDIIINLIFVELTGILNKIGHSLIEASIKQVIDVWKLIKEKCENYIINKKFKIIFIMYLIKLFIPKLSYDDLYNSVSKSKNTEIHLLISKVQETHMIDIQNNIPSDNINKLFDNFFELKIVNPTGILKTIYEEHLNNKIPKFNILNLIYYIYKYSDNNRYSNNNVSRVIIDLRTEFDISQKFIEKNEYIENNIHYYKTLSNSYYYLYDPKYGKVRRKVQIVQDIRKILTKYSLKYIYYNDIRYNLNELTISKIILFKNTDDEFVEIFDQLE